MSEKTAKTDAGKPDASSEASATFRPWGVSFSLVSYTILGVYYLVYPILRDTTLYPLYALGVLSLLASFGFFKLKKWAPWLGAALFPAQIIAPTFAFLAAVEGPGLGSDFIVLAFAVSLVVLIFLSTLSFLFIMDKRRSFK
jgi:hypothetical protein